MRACAALLALGLAAATSAAAQNGATLRDLFDRAASAVPAPAPASPGGKAPGPAKANPQVAGELAPDRLCRHVEESTDVMQKLLDYGGLEAQLRMQRLLASDFKYSDLTPEDRQMLKYIAYTTVWVSPTIEAAAGKAYAAYVTPAASDEAQNRREAAQVRRQDEQLQRFRATIADFPGSVEPLIDPTAPTGASARPGGLILLSRDFLNRMDESPSVQRLVLAHELSHLYKRHTLKELQYRLITSAAGFDLGRRLMRKSMPAGNGSLLDFGRGMLDTLTLGRDVVEFVKTQHAAFGVDQELEADACSVEWMKRSSYDPTELWRAFGELEKVAPGEETSYAVTHPSTADRRKNIDAAIRGPVAASAPGRTKRK